MTLIRRNSRNNVYKFHGTGDASADDLQMSTLEAVIEASNKPAHIIVTGDVHLTSGHLINMTKGGGIKFEEGGMFTFHRGSYWGIGVDFSSDMLTGSTVSIPATAAGQAWVESASNLEIGQYIQVGADNEYTGDYARHGASTESRPMNLRRVIRQINSNQYELNKPIRDALTTNPRYAVIDMIPQAYVDGMCWTFAPNYTQGADPVMLSDNYQGSINSGDVPTLEATFPGSTTDDWASIETGGSAGHYRWDGANYQKVSDVPDSTSVSFDKVNNLRFENGYAINPVPGAVRIRHCNDFVIRGLNHEQKHESFSAVEHAGAGYGILVVASEGGKLNGNKFDTCRHCIDTGAVSSGGHRYGNVQFSAADNDVYCVGGSISAVPFSCHSEGEDITYTHNRFHFSGGTANNTNNHACFIRARDTVFSHNKLFGPGGSNYSTRGVLCNAPGVKVSHNLFEGLGNGIILEAAPGGSGPLNVQALHNTFYDINASALIADAGTGEFSHNTCIDCASNRAGTLLEESPGNGGSGKKSVFTLKTGAGTEWIANQNTIPRRSNDYAFDFGPITPSGITNMQQNTLTGYGVDQPTHDHFTADSSNVTIWRQAFEQSNWTDKFFDDFVAAIPSNPATAGAILMEDGTPMQMEDGTSMLKES